MKTASEAMTDLPAAHSVTIDAKGYAPAHAKQALLKLVNDNLQHHEMQNFSHQIRFGEHHAESKAIIDKLLALKAEAADLIAEAEKHGYKVNINTRITVSVSP